MQRQHLQNVGLFRNKIKIDNAKFKHNGQKCQQITSSLDEKSIEVIMRMIVKQLTVLYNPNCRVFVPTLRQACLLGKLRERGRREFCTIEKISLLEGECSNGFRITT